MKVVNWFKKKFGKDDPDYKRVEKIADSETACCDCRFSDSVIKNCSHPKQAGKQIHYNGSCKRFVSERVIVR